MIKNLIKHIANCFVIIISLLTINCAALPPKKDKSKEQIREKALKLDYSIIVDSDWVYEDEDDIEKTPRMPDISNPPTETQIFFPPETCMHLNLSREGPKLRFVNVENKIFVENISEDAKKVFLGNTKIAKNDYAEVEDGVSVRSDKYAEDSWYVRIYKRKDNHAIKLLLLRYVEKPVLESKNITEQKKK